MVVATRQLLQRNHGPPLVLGAKKSIWPPCSTSLRPPSDCPACDLFYDMGATSGASVMVYILSVYLMGQTVATPSTICRPLSR